MELLEVILIEIVEEAARADRMPRDLEIVNVPLPVRANVVDRRHAGHYTSLDVLRDPRTSSLTARTFDVLVVGGGIYGLTIAYDAAQRGAVGRAHRARRFRQRQLLQPPADDPRRAALPAALDVAARARIGARTARRSRASRRMRVAPAAVRAAALPIADAGARSRCAPAFCSTAIVAADRNRDVAPSLRLPAGRVVSRQHAIERFPGLRRRGLTGAAVWHDYVTPEADRLTLQLGARGRGARRGARQPRRRPRVVERRTAGVGRQRVDRL